MTKTRCEICDRNFKNEEALAMHNNVKHKNPETNNNSFTTSKKKLVWSFIGIAVVALLGWALFSGGSESISGNTIAISSDDPFLGNADAPVTIVEFGDYQCPICQRFWATTLPQIKSQYIETGKVKYVFRDFPLTFSHPMAQASAEAANCVLEQGGTEAYFKYHDTLYANQHSLSTPNLKLWAQEQDYNIGECLDSRRFRKEVQDDFRDGQSLGVGGTPSFFVNGQPINGAQPFPVFQQLIEANL